MTAADTLARTIWGEARGEGREGMEAVACVVLNRLKKPGWWSRNKGDGIPDDTVEAVCRDPWQFSCWNSGDDNLPLLRVVDESDTSFVIALAIASEAIAGTLPDKTRGATHYYDCRMKYPPHWAAGRTPCAIIGRHFFFKDV